MRLSSLLTVGFAVTPALAGTFPITGATGGVYPRLEVRDLHNDPNAWNLFLLAMHSFFVTNQTAQLSYYQIAGIHGVPNVPWDGVGPNPAASGAVGYCTHSSILFPTWHRIYLALFEQIFQEQVQSVANSWPAGSTRTMYQNYAKTMRFPYFDWAAAPPSGLPPWPLIISAITTPVNTPTGQQTIINPLYRYDFNPLVPNDMLFQPWSFWPNTKRYPNTNSSSAAYSQNQLAVTAFQNNRINIRNQLYSVFTQCSQYPEFSNDASADSTPGCSISLEGVHNNIHSMCGGSNQGHMTYLWYASFDPVFWLHHANVDRILAMWQTIWPGQWTSNQVATGNTYTIAKGSTQGASSNLTPFHRDIYGNFWTSSQLTSWTKLGYTYPEFVNSDGSANAIRSYVNALYGPSATATAGSSKRTAMPEPAPAPAVTTDVPEAELVVRELGGPAIVPAVLLSTPGGQRYQYTANIDVQRFALGQSFTVYVFFGQFNQNPASWASEPTLVGSQGIVAMPGMENMQLSVSGAIPLTGALTQAVQNGLLPNLNNKSVVKYLRSNMSWRVATNDGQAVPNAAVPGLEISIVSANCSLPASPSDFPVCNQWKTLPAITNGLAGGLNIGATPVAALAAIDRVARFGHPKE